MSKEGYLYLAKLAYHNAKDFALLTHVVAFLLLCWNLMARAVSVNNILFEHISWDGDAMTINFGATKGVILAQIPSVKGLQVLWLIAPVERQLYPFGYERDGAWGLCKEDTFSKALEGISLWEEQLP